MEENNIKELGEINVETKEGQYLMAALAVITTECRTNKTPDQVIEELTVLKDKMR